MYCGACVEHVEICMFDGILYVGLQIEKKTIGIVYEFYYFPIVICVSLVSKVQGSIFIALLRCSLQVSV